MHTPARLKCRHSLLNFRVVVTLISLLVRGEAESLVWAMSNRSRLGWAQDVPTAYWRTHGASGFDGLWYTLNGPCRHGPYSQQRPRLGSRRVAHSRRVGRTSAVPTTSSLATLLHSPWSVSWNSRCGRCEWRRCVELDTWVRLCRRHRWRIFNVARSHS